MTRKPEGDGKAEADPSTTLQNLMNEARTTSAIIAILACLNRSFREKITRAIKAGFGSWPLPSEELRDAYQAFFARMLVQLDNPEYKPACPEAYILVSAKRFGIDHRNSYLKRMTGRTDMELGQLANLPADAGAGQTGESAPLYLRELADRLVAAAEEQLTEQQLLLFTVFRNNLDEFSSAEPISYPRLSDLVFQQRNIRLSPEAIRSTWRQIRKKLRPIVDC